MKTTICILGLLFFMGLSVSFSQNFDTPYVSSEVVFEEIDGFLTVEAEHYFKQSLVDVRKWYITRFDAPIARPGKDPDGPHFEGASGKAYIEILPDTRTNHDEKLIVGENFMNQAGQMAIVHYKVYIHSPGRYYVWVRTHSTGTEDNGVHVGIDGTWPEHGQRMQWTAKNQWYWDNKQRTKEVHVGVPMEIYLDIERAGEHEIQFSMREDGFEFDKFILVNDKDYRPEQNEGPEPVLKQGKILKN